MADPTQIGRAIATALLADSGVTDLLANSTNVYWGSLPKLAKYPGIVYNIRSGGDENNYASRSLDERWNIEAWANSAGTAAAIADALYVTLHDQTISPTGWTVVWLRKYETISRVEMDWDGNQIFVRGGAYRIRAEES